MGNFETSLESQLIGCVVVTTEKLPAGFLVPIGDIDDHSHLEICPVQSVFLLPRSLHERKVRATFGEENTIALTSFGPRPWAFRRPGSECFVRKERLRAFPLSCYLIGMVGL